MEIPVMETLQHGREMPNVEFNNWVLKALDWVELEEMGEIVEARWGEEDSYSVRLIVNNEDSLFRINTEDLNYFRTARDRELIRWMRWERSGKGEGKREMRGVGGRGVGRKRTRRIQMSGWGNRNSWGGDRWINNL
jgi:predicted DNA-binding antitoxin AbrB/MazE fold protein